MTSVHAPDSETALAVGTVLWRAHERARDLRLGLELEAADPRVRRLMDQAHDVQRAIAALLVEIAIDTVAIDTDCAECLTSVDHCELAASLGSGRCCSECSHGH